MGNPYFYLLGTAWKYAGQQRHRYVLTYVLFISASLLASTTPLLFGWFVNELQGQGKAVLYDAWLYAAAYLVLNLLVKALRQPARVMECKLAFHIGQAFLTDLHQQLLHLPVAWHQDHHSGATINRLRKAHAALRQFFQNGFMFLETFSQFIIAFAAMVYFSPLFGSIGLVLGLVTIRIIFLFDKPYIRSLQEVNEREHAATATLSDGLSNVLTVITLRLEKRIEAELLGKIKAVLPPFYRSTLLSESKWFVAHMLVCLIYCVMVVGYVYDNYQPGPGFGVNVGGLVTLLGYVNQLTGTLYSVAWQYNQVMQYHTDVQAVAGIREAYRQQHRPEAAAPLPGNWQRIDIKELGFRYPDAGGPAPKPVGPATALDDAVRPGPGAQSACELRNLHVTLKRGQRIALIGASGCGKSTLLSLLRGLYTPRAGTQLVVDGIPTPWEAITEATTLFPQEPEIFENTIEFNLTLGLPFSEEEVMRACEIACFAEVVRQLPHGLKSTIQEKGVNLSGGQKQRLALARAVLAAGNSSIVLLDEPTSSIDAQNELRIYAQLFEAFADKVVISSLHHWQLLSLFDYIYILEEGKLVAEGTFEALAAVFACREKGLAGVAR